MTNENTNVVDLDNPRAYYHILNKYLHLNFIQIKDATAYGSLTAPVRTALASVDFDEKSLDDLVNQIMSLVSHLRQKLAEDYHATMDNGQDGIDQFEKFYTPWIDGYYDGINSIADGSLDWVNDTTGESQDQVAMAGYLFGLLAKLEGVEFQTSDKLAKTANADAERARRVICLDYLEEFANIYPASLMQEKGLVNTAAKAEMVKNEALAGIINDDFEITDMHLQYAKTSSAKTDGTDSAVVTLDDSAIIVKATMANLYPRFADTIPVSSRALNYVQKMFGLGTKTLVMRDGSTKEISFGNIVTIGHEAALDQRKIGYGLDWASKFYDVFYIVGETHANRRKFLGGHNGHPSYKNAFESIWKKEMYTNTSIAGIKGFCSSSAYHPCDELFGKRSGAPTITSGVITSANQHVRAQDGFIITWSQASADKTSAFHISPKSMVELVDLLEYLVLKVLFQPGTAHANTLVYNSIKAYGWGKGDEVYAALQPAANVTDPVDQIAKMFFVSDSGVYDTYTEEAMIREFRVIDTDAPALEISGGQSADLLLNLYPDQSVVTRFEEIYKNNNKVLVASPLMMVSKKAGGEEGPDPEPDPDQPGAAT